MHHTSPIYQWLSITARPSYWPGTAYICLYRDDRINWRVIINFSNATAVWMNQFVYWAIVSMRPLSTFVRDFGNGREIDEIGQLVAMNLLMYMVIYSRGVVCRCFILVSTFNLWKRYSWVKVVGPRNSRLCKGQWDKTFALWFWERNIIHFLGARFSTQKVICLFFFSHSRERLMSVTGYPLSVRNGLINKGIKIFVNEN